MKTLLNSCILLLGISVLLSCKVKRPVVNPVVVQQPSIPVPDKVTIKQNIPDFELEFKKILDYKSPGLSYPAVTAAFYQSHNFQPVLVRRFTPAGQLDTLIAYLEASGQHGLDPERFYASDLKKMSDRLHHKKSGNVLNRYKDTVALELTVASSLLKYSNVLQFGLVNPLKIYPEYFAETMGPDSILMMRVLELKNLKSYLDSIQPVTGQYLALQAALKAQVLVPEKSLTETEQLLKLNLERLRWKNRPPGQKYVRVNIADFSLDVIDKGKLILRMKVCVGEVDKQTPQLSSLIYSVQVNPVWNIPESIAQNEILKYASRDKYYLANNNINAFKNGRQVWDLEAIDWKKADIGSYSFKQKPGMKNSLGKIKFLFKNESSVYLHDTPVKSAFNQKNRAVSHGCVRVEKPMELALALFGEGAKYDLIKRAMQRGYPREKYIGLPTAIPISLAYFTALADQKGKVIFNEDIYGLDGVLANEMKK
ncbi:L,D-transpeptidase family protein [Pedobacter heparinus]|uniref:L,D-transpeptidase family protein n=1 Tax=Pedobacter heparinus TaxID=984 RepID=UPI00292F0909|nr:L,D-transpeptidase family protein [Pedobacter heparinus]